jgi:hypothetical protein
MTNTTALKETETLLTPLSTFLYLHEYYANIHQNVLKRHTELVQQSQDLKNEQQQPEQNVFPSLLI